MEKPQPSVSGMLAILAGTTLVSSLIIVSINFEFDDVNENYSLFMLIGSVLIYYLGLIVCSIGTSLIVAIRFLNHAIQTPLI